MGLLTFLQKRKQSNNTTLLRHRRILSADGVDYNIAEAPLYFVRSGAIGIDYGRLWTAGDTGYYTSSFTFSNANQSYRIGFSTVPYPSSVGRRFTAFPLRCILEHFCRV